MPVIGFRNAAANILKRAGDYYRRNPKKVHGSATALGIGTAAFATCNPWLAVPVALGGSVWGLGIADSQRFAGFGIGTAVFGISLFASTIVQAVLGPIIPFKQAAQNIVDETCISSIGQIINIRDRGEVTRGTVVKVTQSTEITVNGSEFFYAATVSYPWKLSRPFFGLGITGESSVKSASRPGTWEPGMKQQTLDENRFVRCPSVN